MFLALMVSCWSPEQLCAGRGDTSLVLGEGSGTEFISFEDGQAVEIMTPPQGGFGLPFRARSLGLRIADQFLDLEMRTEVDGEVLGDFLYQDMIAYCQEDGSGLMWGTATPIDHPDFVDAEDLEALRGKEALMVVTATDAMGDQVVAEAWVEISLRE
ncbi:MAG: hypothetical protein ACI9VR_004497 [Cognaticolwellia sp.]|jgi:hypothetical protein